MNIKTHSASGHRIKTISCRKLFHITIIMWNQAGEEFHRRLAGFFESSQRAGRSHKLAQFKQRFSSVFCIELLFRVDLGFALQRRGVSPRMKNKCPS